MIAKWHLVLAMAAVSAWAADSVARFDVQVNQKDSQKLFVLEPVATESVPKPQHPNWHKDVALVQSWLTFQDAKPLSADQWKTFVFKFKSEGAGVVDFRIGGGFTAKEEERQWVYACNVKVNGVSYKENGDFKKTIEVKAQNNKRMPVGYWLSNKSQLAEVDGKTVAHINHDNRLSFRLNVVEGETYEISVDLKAAPKP
ncbi:MAG: hypothetical protein IJJ26_06795 [Victivallales bacterium]|nr:hypothetical protein [Victivallales bacterium]